MAETFLGVVVQELMSKASSLVAQEVSLAWGFKSDLEKFAERVQMIRALLSDAEEKKVSSDPVKRWLNKLKGVAYDANGAMDELEYEILRQNLETKGRKKNKVCDFFSPARNSFLFRLKMSHKIKDINSSLDETYKVASQIQLFPGVTDGANKVKELQQTLPGVGDVEKVVGRSSDVSDIVRALCADNEKKLSVVSIVGMPGQGKTALAQLVYKNDNVSKHFDKMVWVCVSDNFEVIRLLSEMVQSLTCTDPQMSNLEGIIKELQKHLEGKKYLLVLDDVWNKAPEKWESMQNALLLIGGSRKSKILVTTRSEEVVRCMKVSLNHHLGKLSDDDCWILFKERVFAEGGVKETPELVDIGREMVKRCDGVPLAVKMLGFIMYYKKEEREWLEISQLWNLPGEIDKRVKASLMLSYNHFPSLSLKLCFSLCSMIPKDSKIYKDKLVQLWMALGLLHPSEGSHSEMEDIGNKYFNTFLWSSLLQDVERDEYGNITCSKMHNLVRDLTLYTSKNYCLTSESSNVDDMNGIVHLSLSFKRGEMPKIPKVNLQRLQTLSVNCGLFENISCNLKYLRVLILSGGSTEELQKSIGKLKYLRYLDVSRTSMKTLPSSITKLYNLQTLRLYGLEAIPKNFNHLINLRHIYVSKLDWSRKLLLIEIGQLISLQTLPLFNVGREEGCLIGELGALDNLKGELSIYHLEDVQDMEDARSANLCRKSNVDTLRLAWGSRNVLEWRADEEDFSVEEYNDVDEGRTSNVLEALEPHMNLKCLWIQKFSGTVFAPWMMSVSRSAIILKNLVKIVLRGCERCERIPTLGHLPYLKDIVIVGMSNVKCIGTEFYSDDDGARKIDVAGAKDERSIEAKFYNEVDDGGAKRAGLAGVNDKEISHDDGCIEVEISHDDECIEVEFYDNVADGGAMTVVFSSKLLFPALKRLVLKDLRSLEEWAEPVAYPSSSFATTIFPCLEELVVGNCPVLKKAPSRFPCSITKLTISGFSDSMALEGLSSKLTSVVHMEIGDIDGVLLEKVLRNNTSSLRRLTIRDCEKLSCLPHNLRDLVHLSSLKLEHCSGITSVLEEVCSGLASSLKELRLYRLEKMTFVPKIVSLEVLKIRYCSSLTEVPDIRSFTSLRRLDIYQCSGLRGLPSGLEECTSLEDLRITECAQVKSVPDLRLLTNLMVMEIGGFSEELGLFPWPYFSPSSSSSSFSNVGGSSLRSLTLVGWEKLKSSLPEGLQLLSTLKHLELTDFEDIESLPEWLGKLSSLETLYLYHFENLRNLPMAMQRLTNLQNLHISRCPHLAKRCTKGRGPEWSKIARISQIEIDAETIQDLT